MNLYVVRHAEAVKVGGHIKHDTDRILSKEGEAEALLMGQVLARLAVRVHTVMSSPLVRAAETGRVLAAQLGSHIPVHVTEQLAPAFNPKSLLAEILEKQHGGNVLLVGHQPDMSLLISYLVAGTHDAAIRMGTCSIASLHIQPDHPKGTAQLQWLITAEMARVLLTTP